MEFSSWELLVILVVALIVLGPNRLSEVAHGVGRFTRAMRNLKERATAELDLQEKHWQLQKNIEKAQAAEQLKAQEEPTSGVTPEHHV